LKPADGDNFMAQNIYAPLVGRRVGLNPALGAQGPFRACICGSTTGRISKGISSHPGHLKCDACGKHLAWIGAKHMDALLAADGAGKKKRGAA
jgi:hypothetical protein